MTTSLFPTVGFATPFIVRLLYLIRCGNHVQGLVRLDRLKMSGFINEALATRIRIPSRFDSLLNRLC
jgi:hypothetical protein